MNDTPISASVSSSPSSALSAEVLPHNAAVPRRQGRLALFLILALLLVLVAAAAWLHVLHQGMAQHAAHLSESLDATQKELTQTHQQVSALNESMEQLKSQRADLEQLVADLHRGRDETVLIEVERWVNAAATELQLAGNVPAAMHALQSADARLARMQGSAARAPLLALRKSIARDIERLRALPTVDVTGMALRLDEIAPSVENWPMLADPAALFSGKEIPVGHKDASAKESSVTAKHKSATLAEASEASNTADDFWPRVRQWLREELGDLVRIREVQTPESVLLSTTQQQLVRHQLRLRLFDARQALIARNDRLYRSDLQEARVLLQRYFDLKSPAPAAALALIDKLQANALSVDIPNAALTETLTATQNLLASTRTTVRP